MQELHISVRNLVEFIFRAGDIDNRAGKLASAEAMMEGSRIHRKIQKSMDTSYQAEVPLKIDSCDNAEAFGTKSCRSLDSPSIHAAASRIHHPKYSISNFK